MYLSEKLAGPASSLTYKKLPKEIVEKTKLCILHSLACSYAGREASWSEAARKLAGDLAAAGPSSIWFSKQGSNMAEAALANAVAAQSILHEDIHRDSNAHPGIIVVPAAWAAAESLGADGRSFLTAVVAGYEMMGRLGRGTVSLDFGQRGFRPTSIIGTFGSAAAAGLLLGLTLSEHLCAFALAANFTSGINQWAIAGSDDLYFQNGWAARGGIIAALLAKSGVTAPRDVLEGKSGFIKAYGFSEKNLLELNCQDGRYVISEVLFKPAPACALVQTTAQAALDALAQGVRPEDIASGKIITFALGQSYAGCDNPGPFEKLLPARMSNQFNLAASLIKGKISNQNYVNFTDPEVNELAAKMSLEVDPQYTKAFPDKQPVRLEFTMKGGEILTFYREEPVYLDSQAVIDKLFEHLEPEYGRVRVEKIVEGIFSLEKLDRLEKLSQLLRP